MRVAALLLVVLTGCGAAEGDGNTPPSNVRDDSRAIEPGISLSGYAQIGVSRRF